MGMDQHLLVLNTYAIFQGNIYLPAFLIFTIPYHTIFFDLQPTLKIHMGEV